MQIISGANGSCRDDKKMSPFLKVKPDLDQAEIGP